MPHAASQLEQARRFGEPISVLMIDIDHFKQINDRFGHGRGDEILHEVGRRLRETLRGLDAVCRYGGEEFVVLLPRTGHSVAVEIAERIRGTLRQIARGDDQEPLTASIGVSTAYGDEPGSYDTDELIHRADAALYDAKSGGRDRVCSAAGHR